MVAWVRETPLLPQVEMSDSPRRIGAAVEISFPIGVAGRRFLYIERPKILGPPARRWFGSPDARRGKFCARPLVVLPGGGSAAVSRKLPPEGGTTNAKIRRDEPSP